MFHNKVIIVTKGIEAREGSKYKYKYYKYKYKYKYKFQSTNM